jgi:hypothetical protein
MIIESHFHSSVKKVKYIYFSLVKCCKELTINDTTYSMLINDIGYTKILNNTIYSTDKFAYLNMYSPKPVLRKVPLKASSLLQCPSPLTSTLLSPSGSRPCENRPLGE